MKKGLNDLKDDDPASWSSLDFPVEVAFYAAVCVIFLLVIALMLKLVWNWDDDDTRQTETSGLLRSKVEVWYGTREDNIESTGKKSCNSSVDDLYDAKICVICYDDQRCCLFVPCGHCVTCYNCTKRIIGEETKSCPICRTVINKVKMLRICESGF